MRSADFSITRVMQVLASSVMGQLIAILQTYLLVPLFLRAWGDHGYGRWLALTALASYLSLLDLGGQNFVGNRLAFAFAQSRLDDFRATLSQGFTLFTLISVGALAVVCAALAIPVLSWDTSSKLIVFWYSSAVILAVPSGVLATSYAATGLSAQGALIGNIVRLISLALFALALYRGCSAAQYAGLFFATALAGTLFIVGDLRRRLGSMFTPRLSIAAYRSSRALIGGSFDFWLFASAGALNLQGLILLLSHFEGDRAVALFATHRAGASLITYAGNLLRPALWPEMTFLAARSDISRLKVLVSVAVRISTFGAACVGAAICVAAPLGYALWTRSKLQLDVPLLAILSVQAVLAAAWSTTGWPLLAANKPRFLAIFTAINALSTIVAAYVGLAMGLGVHAAATASLAADLLFGLIAFPLFASAYLKVEVRAFVLDALRALACAVPFGCLAYLCSRFVRDDVLRMASFAVATALLAWPTARMLLRANELQRLTDIWKRR